MLSPENPSCSPETLGTTGTLCRLPLCLSRSFNQSISLSVLVSQLSLLSAKHLTTHSLTHSPAQSLGQSAVKTKCRHVGLHPSKKLTNLSRKPTFTFIINCLYVSCTPIITDAQYDASIRDLRNCDDLTLLLAACWLLLLLLDMHNQHKMLDMPKTIFGKHGLVRLHFLESALGRVAARLGASLSSPRSSSITIIIVFIIRPSQARPKPPSPLA